MGSVVVFLSDNVGASQSQEGALQALVPVITAATGFLWYLVAVQIQQRITDKRLGAIGDGINENLANPAVTGEERVEWEDRARELRYLRHQAKVRKLVI